MTRYYITHEDEAGEKHQLHGAWETASPEDAIRQMFAESGYTDDGRWEAHVVTSERDVIYVGGLDDDYDEIYVGGLIDCDEDES